MKSSNLMAAMKKGKRMKKAAMPAAGKPKTDMDVPPMGRGKKKKK